MLLKCKNGDQSYFQYLYLQCANLWMIVSIQNFTLFKGILHLFVVMKRLLLINFLRRIFLEVCDPYAIRVETFIGNGRRKQDELLIRN